MKSIYFFLLIFIHLPQVSKSQENNVVKKELICKVPTEKIFINKTNLLNLKKQEFVSEFSIKFFTIINDTFIIINPLEKSIVKISKNDCSLKYNPMPKTIGDFNYCEIDSNYNYYTCTYAQKIRIFDKGGKMIFVDSIGAVKFKINSDNNVVYDAKRCLLRDRNKIIKRYTIKHLDASYNSDYYLNKNNLVILKGEAFKDNKLVFLKYALKGNLIDSIRIEKGQSVYDIIILNYDQIKQEYLVFAGNSNDKDLPQLLTINGNGDILSHKSLQKDKTDWGKIVSDIEFHYIMPDGLTYHYEAKENALYVIEMDRNYLYISKYNL